MIRVLLVDDHVSFRQPLAFMFDREPDLEVVGQAGSIAEARGQLAGIDLAVVDLNLPDGTGLELIAELRGINPAAMALVLTASVDKVEWGHAIEAGATGILHKSSTIADIITASRRLTAGEHLLSPREVSELLRLVGQQREQSRTAQQALARLTPREREVLQALADGLNDKEIALRLKISTETARSHMVNILGKLGVDSRLQALVFAVRHGAITIR
jgi:DNA-binding NarL/FixJ family response regulator